MKIGIFDSGLGGLIILKAIRQKLPVFDYVYLGDTKNLPYGNKTQKEIYNFLKQGLNFLFKQNCVLIIVACNTASAMALRKIQRQYLPKHYPNRRVLGVIRSTVEQINKHNLNQVILIGTKSTIDSKSYIKELQKINSKISITSLATPKLVPFLENLNNKAAEKSLDKYLTGQSLQNKTLILGCTHYPLLKTYLRRIHSSLKILSQDEIIPTSLFKYLNNHPEIKKHLTRKATVKLFVTKNSLVYKKRISQRFLKNYKIQSVQLD